MKVWRKPGLGHHPHGLDPVDPLLEEILRANGMGAGVPAGDAERSSGGR